MARGKLSKIIGVVIVVAIVAGGGYAVYANTHNSKANENQNLVLSVSSTPPTMNPLYANSNSSLVVADAMYEPVYNIGENGKLDFNGLAKSMTHSADAKTYTLTLKPNLKWSDGQALTANDVVFTFDSIMNPKNNALLTQTFMMDGKAITAKALNSTTIEFILPAPSLGFEQNLAQLYPIPEHIYKNVKDLKNAPENKKPVGDGPYKFESEQAGSTVTLVRNDNFYGEKANISNLVFKVIPNQNAGVAALESGQLSVGNLSEKLLANKKISDNYNVEKFGSGLVNSVVFNFTNKNLQNLKVRQAIAYALNREDLTKAEYGNSKYVTPANSVFSPETQYYTNDVKTYNYDLTKAQDLMKESGAKDVTLRLSYAAGFKWAQDEALVIQQNLSKIGIKVELEPIELNSFFQEIFTPNSTKYDLAINGYNMGTTPDGYSTVFTTKGANNASNFSNPKIDKLFKEAQTSTNVSQREDLYKEVQEEVSENLPVYTINYPETILGVSKKISGIKEAAPTPIALMQNFGALYYNK
ncbi:ABC transporter substrate-binding protein [uncultured Clostridium sp.]|jgi:peptide/nickel transport system substrate-binding protein|uniref:ABC transporter substrate-binding protein n=1 Tax=uncultured Clostridium sp. TaxID=59620 RepID=UPI00261A707E|nr:ABC transporter substrate-binding protein [uncultured Clostridium sp.]